LSVTVKDDTIYVDDGDYTFSDIYDKVSQDLMSENHVEKAGDNMYYFDYNIVIGKTSPANIVDKNVSVVFNKEEFQIHEDSKLQLGELIDGTPLNGCKLSLPNVKLGYGFGCKDKDDESTLSGNLYLYDSYMDIPGFWGFFNTPDKQIVEIINCTINGFGRISGTESIVQNVIFIKADKKYGTFSTIGEIKKFKNLRIMQTDKDNDGVCLYFNPEISGDCKLSNIEFPYDYKKLVYCESCDDVHYFDLINSNQTNLKCEFEDSNAYINLISKIQFLPYKDNHYIEIFYNDNKIDSFYTKDKDTTLLKHKTLNKDSDTTYSLYKVIIDTNIEFEISAKTKQIIPIEAFYRKMRPLWDNSFFFNETADLYLGDIYNFLVKSYDKPIIKMYKTGNGVMAEPTNIEQQSVDNLYKVSFLIGELGEDNDNGEKWTDGVYYLHGVDVSNNQTFIKEVYIHREEERHTNKVDVKFISDKIDKNKSEAFNSKYTNSSAVIIM